MSGRRLTISSLLCADDQPPESPQPSTSERQTEPLPLQAPFTLTGPGVPPTEYRGAQFRDRNPGHAGPERDGYRSRAYSDDSRGSHAIVPLSQQSVHLRRQISSPHIDDLVTRSASLRESRHGPVGRHDILTNDPRGLVSPMNRDQESNYYHSSDRLPQASPLSIPSSRRSSDPNHPKYRLVEGSSYFAPPTSSRSGQADVLGTPSTYPPAPPLPSSLSHSPPHASFLHQPSHSVPRPAQSPLLALHHPSTSPTHSSRPMSHHSPHTHSPPGPYPAPSPSTLIQSPSRPSASSPRQEPFAAGKSHRSTSFSLSEVPLTTPRASSVMSLLNTEPARTPISSSAARGRTGVMDGLDMLVEAATSERRRLSGELPTPLDIRETARRTSLSPVLNRVPPPLPQPSSSPVLHRSQMPPSPRVDTRVNSLAVISLPSGEPPLKKRRRTGSFGTVHSTPHHAAGSSPVVQKPPRQLDPPSSSTHATISTDEPHATQTPSTSPQVVPRPITPPPQPAAPHVPKRTSISQLLSPEPLPSLPPSIAHTSQLRSPLPVSEPLSTAPSLPPRVEVPDLVDVPEEPPSQAIVPETPSQAREPEGGEEAQSPEPSSRAELEPELLSLPQTTVVVSPSADVDIPAATRSPVTEQDPSGAMVPEEEEEPPAAPAVAMEEEEDPPPPEVAIEDEQPVPASEATHETSLPTVIVPEVDIAVAHTPEVVEETIAVVPNTPPRDEMDVDPSFSPSSAIAKEEEEPVVVPAVKVETAEQVQSEMIVDSEVVDSEVVETPQEPVSRPESSRDEDPHDWLLEQFAEGSPPRDSLRASPVPEEPPHTPALSDSKSPPAIVKEEISRQLTPSPPPQPETKRSAKKATSISRSPTPTALLEQELDGISVDEGIPGTAQSPRSDADTDFGLELDLAASTTPDVGGDAEVSSSNDLDDELLSLVDDNPRIHSHSHHHRAPLPKSSSSTSHSTHQGQATATKEPAAKEHVTKKPVVLTATRVASNTAPSERITLPPPIQPPAQVYTPKSTAPQEEKAEMQSDKSDVKSMSTEGAIAAAVMKKKEPASKPVPKEKAKAQTKPKPRPAGKPKAKASKEKESAPTPGSSGRLTPSGSGTATKGKKTHVTNAAVASAAKRAVSAAAGPSRSRSTSEMPTPAEPASKPKAPADEEEQSEEEEVDDKLYCICKTSYDEDKVMIACDRCDEWYHTQCLNMNDLEVDLIDQFVCPPCVEANPHLSLRTTYKQRCMAGLKHPHPSSPSACHKPARGAFSKFCSDECGITYMQHRIEGWGGNQAALWASVKDTKQREGVVVKVHVEGAPNGVAKDGRLGAGNIHQESYEVQTPTKSQRARKIARLQALLDEIAPKREEHRKDLDLVHLRQKICSLAERRASRVQECGWDHRLCYDDDEIAPLAAAVLESYSEFRANGNVGDNTHADGTMEDGEWWCRGQVKCQRHAGWQKLRSAEYAADTEFRQNQIDSLNMREREIRKQLEDAHSLPDRTPVSQTAFLSLNGHQPPNGVKTNGNSGTGRKGKQRK